MQHKKNHDSVHVFMKSEILELTRIALFPVLIFFLNKLKIDLVMQTKTFRYLDVPD